MTARTPKQVRKGGPGQAVRLPKKLTYEQVMAIVGKFKGRIGRHQPPDQNRKWR